MSTKQQQRPTKVKVVKKQGGKTRKTKSQKALNLSQGSYVKLAKKQYKDVIPQAWAQDLVNQLKVAVPFNYDSLNLAIISWISFLLNKNVHSNVMNQGLASPWLAVYNGAAYLLDGIITQIGGSTMTLTHLPAGIDELIAALSPTEVNAGGYGKISYAWDDLPTGGNAGTLLSVPNVDGIWEPTHIAGDNGSWNAPAVVVNAIASSERYGELLKLIGGLGQTPCLKVVENGKAKYSNSLLKDPSSFARVYVYNGLVPVPTAGYWKDIELETDIGAPLYSNFCEYTVPDKRVPKKLTPFSGDAGMAAAWNLHPTFTSPFTKTPVVFKQVDFEEIYFTLAAWASKAKEALATSVINANPEAVAPFTFTMQDFRIILRQALMNLFDTQYMTQFTGALSSVNGSNCFVPFMVMGNTCANPVFNQFKLPILIAENLAALRARNLSIPGKSRINTPTIMPVLGRYYQDTPANFLYTFNGVSTDLFAPPDGQTLANLTDGRISQNTYINFNGEYYQSVLANWNDFVQTASAVTTPYKNILDGSGPAGLGILHYTRIEEAYVGEGYVPYVQDAKTRLMRPRTEEEIVSFTRQKARVPKSRAPPLNKPAYVRNMKYIKNSGIDGIKALPPASMTSLTPVGYTTSLPLIPDQAEFFNLIITPSVRYSTETEDALTTPMYQTETTEMLSSFSNLNILTNGSGMASKCFALAQCCITGAAKQEGSLYSAIMDELNRRGDGGILAKLLGGFAKQIIPGADGVIDTVASLVPF